MFEPYETKEFKFKIGGRQERVEIVYSLAKQEALGEHRRVTPGNNPYGRHAGKNTGISVVRENREIVLEPFLIRGGASGGGGSAPENRWWGCEIRFNRSLDDLFGVDHNKQMVSHLSRAIKDMFESEDRDSVVLENLGIEEDDADIYVVASHIRNTTRTMLRQELRQMFNRRPARISQGGESKTPEQQAAIITSQVTEEDIKSGEVKPTPTDIDRADSQ